MLYHIAIMEAMEIPLRLAIDLDGVLHDPSNIKKGYKLGQPIPGAKGAMQRYKAQGAVLVIHSVWADTDQKREAMSKWLRYFDIPYDFITNIKPIADFYIDNNGVRFTTWDEVSAFIDANKPSQEN